jgi:hypothetical protein
MRKDRVLRLDKDIAIAHPVEPGVRYPLLPRWPPRALARPATTSSTLADERNGWSWVVDLEAAREDRSALPVRHLAGVDAQARRGEPVIFDSLLLPAHQVAPKLGLILQSKPYAVIRQVRAQAAQVAEQGVG